MKALKIILVILVILVAIFFIVALFLPKQTHMEESLVINKSASVIFKQVNNFHNWPAWSPWQAGDPEMTNTFEGPEQGVDAKNAWKSKKYGDGSMTIIESVPYKKITSALSFTEGDPGTSSFVFSEDNGATKVTWSVDLPDMGYPMGRYFGLMMPGMMKPFFVDGLNKLKEITEAMPDPPALQIVDMQEKAVICIIDSCSWSDIGMKIEAMFTELYTAHAKAKCEITGAPFSLFHKWDEVNQFTVFENCLPIDREIAPKGRIQYKVMPATRAVMGTHFGSYEKTMYMYVALDEYIKDFGLQSASGPIEEYVTDPMMEPDTAKWQTNIYFPVK